MALFIQLGTLLAGESFSPALFLASVLLFRGPTRQHVRGTNACDGANSHLEGRDREELSALSPTNAGRFSD
jgi:hypothetical protein